MQHRNIASTQAEECATSTTININAVAAALFHLHRESVFRPGEALQRGRR